MKQLLFIFAHRGEAQSFLKHRSFKAVPFAFDGLYFDQQDFLLICGEGHLQASQKLSAVLAVHHENISKIVNLGVCGSLRSVLDLDKMFEVRSTYLERDGAMEFKSHTSESLTQLPKADLITTHQRVLSKEYANKLENFALLVDREAWGLASVAQLFHLPFSAIKIVSDFAGSGEEICVAVKEKSEHWSEELYDFVSQFWPEHEEPLLIDFTIPNQLTVFHWTLSQKRELKNALDALQRKGIQFTSIEKQLNLSELELDKRRPKEKSSFILKMLWELINPFHSKIHQSLELEIASLNSGTLKAKYDKSLETDDLHIQAVIQHPRHLEQLKKSIESFDYSRFQKVLKGELDV